MMDRYLQHHGVRGQRWGVRRYQNEDGSLTDAGRRRYIKRDGSLTKEGKSLYNEVSAEQYRKTVDAYNIEEATKNLASISYKWNDAYFEWIDLMNTAESIKSNVDRLDELETALEQYSKEYQRESEAVTKSLLEKYGTKPVNDMFRIESTYEKDQDEYMKTSMENAEKFVKFIVENETLPVEWY